MKKKIIASVAAIAIASLGFSVAPASAADESSCGTAAGFCVGLVTDVGKVDDKSFNQSAWQGAKTAAAALNGFSKYIETQDPKKITQATSIFCKQEVQRHRDC